MFENVSLSLLFGSHQPATTSSGFVNQLASTSDLISKVQVLESRLAQMDGLLRTLTTNQGATNQAVQDLSSKVLGGSEVELGLICIKNIKIVKRSTRRSPRRLTLTGKCRLLTVSREFKISSRPCSSPIPRLFRKRKELIWTEA